MGRKEEREKKRKRNNFPVEWILKSRVIFEAWNFLVISYEAMFLFCRWSLFITTKSISANG